MPGNSTRGPRWKKPGCGLYPIDDALRHAIKPVLRLWDLGTRLWGRANTVIDYTKLTVLWTLVDNHDIRTRKKSPPSSLHSYGRKTGSHHTLSWLTLRKDICGVGSTHGRGTLQKNPFVVSTVTPLSNNRLPLTDIFNDGRCLALTNDGQGEMYAARCPRSLGSLTFSRQTR